jgi:hypothetical protein
MKMKAHTSVELLEFRRMASSGTSRRVALVRRGTKLNITEDAILHSHRRENLKSYIQELPSKSLPIYHPPTFHHVLSLLTGVSINNAK